MDLSPLLLTLALAADGWTSRADVDGISVETRPIAGSSYESVRVSKTSPVPPEVQAEAVWGRSDIEGVANRKNVRIHDVLVDEPNHRLIYEVIHAPLISDRDYVLETSRRKDGEVYEIKFWTREDPRFPPGKDGKIRMTVKGSAIIEPDGKGGSILTYEVYSDLGGSLPAWIARPAQRDSTVEWIRVMIARGEKQHASGAR